MERERFKIFYMVAARDLQAGDVLVSTDRIVIWVGQTLKTPNGKVTVKTRTADGRTFTGDWGRSTRIAVARADA